MSKNKKLIEEYKNDIKLIRRQIQKIKHLKKPDERTAEDRRDLSILGEMLSSTQYSLWWIKNGYEKPYSSDDFKKLSIDRRTQLWADVDEAIQYHGTMSRIEIAFKDYLIKEEKKEKKKEQLIQVNEILTILSPREKEYFLLKNEAMLTEEECAEKLEIELGTVKSMAQRVRNKIDRYFHGSTQMDLFNFYDDE